MIKIADGILIFGIGQNSLMLLGLIYLVFVVWVSFDIAKKFRRNIWMRWVSIILVWSVPILGIIWLFVRKRVPRM